MNYLFETYAAKGETQVYKIASSTKANKQRKLLMGTWLGVLAVLPDDWLKIKTFGKVGYVKTSDTMSSHHFKAFFIDVGQGDAMLIEAPGKTILVDGGPSVNLYNYLTKWKYKWIILANKKIKIDAIIISHFDADHFNGLTSIIDHPNFEIGAIYHNGIVRFHDTKKGRLDKYDTDIGATNYEKGIQQRTILKTSFSTIDDCEELIEEIPNDKKGLQASFQLFIEACINANKNGRLGKMKRLSNRNKYVPGFPESADLSLQLLGPVLSKPNGKIEFDWFDDAAMTRNGHSLVIRLDYLGKSLLLSGDLNTLSEKHLLKAHNNKVFDVDVAKACHHGSSDFTVEFLKKTKPYATVISSGDNESHAHPRADAIGCAGKYSKSDRPMVFSTELARSYSSGKAIHYGLINLRTNGKEMIMAQMKEKKVKSDLWDSYVIQ